MSLSGAPSYKLPWPLLTAWLAAVMLVSSLRPDSGAAVGAAVRHVVQAGVIKTNATPTDTVSVSHAVVTPTAGGASVETTAVQSKS